MFSKGQVYHKHCFKCNVCHRQLDSRIACDGPDRGIYCNGEWKDKSGRRLGESRFACPVA